MIPRNVFDPEIFFHEILDSILEKLVEIRNTIPEKLLSSTEPHHFYMLKAELRLLFELEKFIDESVRDEMFKKYFK